MLTVRNLPLFAGLLLTGMLAACGGSATPTVTPEVPTATPAPTPAPTSTQDPGILAAPTEPAATALPAVATRLAAVAAAAQQPAPIMLLTQDVSSEQALAQALALQDGRFVGDLRDRQTGAPLRSEVFGIFPVRESDITDATAACRTATCFRVELYNYALNATTVAMVDVTDRQVLAVNFFPETQPDLPPDLTQMAVDIAINAPEVERSAGLPTGRRRGGDAEHEDGFEPHPLRAFSPPVRGAYVPAQRPRPLGHRRPDRRAARGHTLDRYWAPPDLRR